MLPARSQNQNSKKLRTDLKINRKNQNLSLPKIYSFFQPLFYQRTSAHLQNANAKPATYFAKELIFSFLLV